MRKGLLLICLIFGLTTLSLAETITIGAENDWAPYARGDGTGMGNDIVKAAFAAVGVDVVFKVQPYNRLLKTVKQGKMLGCFNVPKDSGNENEYIFGKHELYSADAAYFHNVNKPLRAKQKEGLKYGEKIGVVYDYGYGDFFNSSVKKGYIIKVEKRSDAINLKMLDKGRIDGTIIYDKTANILIKKLGISDTVKKAFGSESTNIYVAFSKSFPKSRYYANKLDKGLSIIKKNGVHQKILAAY
jgi:polar amino acid transport system substrate-binding protein